MKTVLLTITLVAVMVAAFAYGLEKTMDNRCDYYRTLAHPTTQMLEMCK